MDDRIDKRSEKKKNCAYILRLGYRYRRVYNVSWSLTRGEPSVAAAAAVGFSRAFPFSGGENRSAKNDYCTVVNYVYVRLLYPKPNMPWRVHTEIKTNPCCRRVVPLRRAAESAAHRKCTSVAGAETRCAPCVIIIMRGPLRQNEWEITRAYAKRKESVTAGETPAAV